MELAEYLSAYQDYWSDNLSKLLAIKASETITVDAALLRLIADLDEPTYLQVLTRLRQLLELASPLDTPTADAPTLTAPTLASLADSNRTNGKEAAIIGSQLDAPDIVLMDLLAA